MTEVAGVAEGFMILIQRRKMVNSTFCDCESQQSDKHGFPLGKLDSHLVAVTVHRWLKTYYTTEEDLNYVR